MAHTIQTIELVTIETMPEQHRSSHIAAGYSGIVGCGRYPFNGASRDEVPADEATDLIADDPDWTHEISRRIVETIDGYRLADADEIADADGPTHESAEDWYASLGYHVSTNDGDVTHPVCAMAEVDTYEPQGDAERDLLTYARAARDAATGLADALARAVDAWRLRDLAECVAALGEARSIEEDYGDWPATRDLRERLLVEVL